MKDMNSELRVDPRHEKNRHHLATALVLLIRTVNIETGVRRSSLDSGRGLQRKERGLLLRFFGITFVEDVPQLSKHNDLVSK
jgi:hypothetical protein